MRFCILTYHYVYNEGAIWQACALCSYLRSAYPGHSFEIFDYRHASKHASIAAGRSPELVKAYGEVLRGELSAMRMDSDRTDELFRVLPRRYDAVIVGSDIIWQFEGKRSLSARLLQSMERRGDLRPSKASPYAFARDVKNWAVGIWRGATGSDPRKISFPNAYWLSPDLPMRKAAYAASIGYSDIRRIPRDVRERMAQHIRALDFISGRDRATLNFLNALSPDLGERARPAPDPAWLFDQALPDVGEKLRSAGVPSNVPVAGVLWPSSGGYGERLRRWALPLLKERGFHVVSIIDANPAADTDLAARVLTPFEWWSAIRAMDFLVTVRTHPSIAALKYGTPLFNVDITAMLNRCAHSKSRDMLGTFGLEDVCLHRRADFNERTVCAGLAHALNRAWDWPAIAVRAEQHRQQARAVCADMMEALARP